MEGVVSRDRGGEIRGVAHVEVDVREGVGQGCNKAGEACGHERSRGRLSFVNPGEPGFASNVAYIRRSASHPG